MWVDTMCHHRESTAWDEIRDRLLERDETDPADEWIEREAPDERGDRRERPGTPTPADD